MISLGVKVLILSMDKGTKYAFYAFTSGSEGYLLKQGADTELFAAIEKNRQGDSTYAPVLW